MNTCEKNKCERYGAAAHAESTSIVAKAISGELHRACEPVEGRGRVHFLDNLRTFMVFLVILCHSGGVYESSGVWASFWIVDDPAVNNLAGLVNIVLDIFMIPTLFFISGYLVPASLQRRSGWAFLRAKFARLMLPWIAGSLVLLPLYKVIFLYSRHLPQEAWGTYFHWSNGIWGQNWLWFLPVLFAFNVLFVLLWKSRLRDLDIPLKYALFAALPVGFGYCIGMDLLGLQGWTKTAWIDFQNERLLIYFMAFLVGAVCFKRKLFEGKPKGRVVYHVMNSLAWIPVMVYIIFLLHPWFHPGRFIVSPILDRAVLWLGYLLSLLCLMYVTIETFRRYQNKQGWVRKELNRSAYPVYIIHTIVLGILATAMLGLAISSLLKYSILVVSTFVASNAIVLLSRRASTQCLHRGVRAGT